MNHPKTPWFRPALLLALALLMACGSTDSEVQNRSGVDPDDLSLAALKLKKGVSRQHVIELLGKPDWAAIPGDPGDFGVNDPKTGLILYWRNPGLAVVEVQFDTDLLVRWDGGAPLNSASYTHMFEPGANYDCGKPDRAELCR